MPSSLSRLKSASKLACVSGAALLMLFGCKSKSTADMDLPPLERIEAAMETAKSTTGAGSPVMWKMADEDTTIYLFGTVHLLPSDVVWRSDRFDAAFQGADKIYLETDATSPEGMKKLQELMQEAAFFSDGETLETVLTETQYETVSNAAKKIGVPISAMSNAKPWFASLQLSMVQIMKSGYDPNSGVEMVLTEGAKGTGKSFGFLETPEFQLSVLSGAPLNEQIEGLMFTAKTLDSGTELLDLLVDEWADGDIAGLSALMGEPSMFGSQEAYDALIKSRNQNWVPLIEDILEEPGTKFVAVGAGHLAGPDSVVKMLRDKGHDVAVVE
jgi:uncharacterized protein YbaP (TraB family)